MKKEMSISLTILLVGAIFVATNVVYSKIPLTIHLAHTDVLTANGIDIEVLKTRIKEVFATGDVDITFTTEPLTNSPGHVLVDFLDQYLKDENGKDDPNILGTRIYGYKPPPNPSFSARQVLVSVKAILDSHKNFYDIDVDKARIEKAFDVARTAIHEVAELYLEDYDGSRPELKDCPWVMKSNLTPLERFKDAQNPALRFTYTTRLMKDGKTIHPADDAMLAYRILNDIIGYHDLEDEVFNFRPSEPYLEPGRTLLCSVVGEELASPVSGVQMVFTAWRYRSSLATQTSYTDDNGQTSFYVPLGATSLDAIVQYNGMQFAAITVEPSVHPLVQVYDGETRLNGEPTMNIYNIHVVYKSGDVDILVLVALIRTNEAGEHYVPIQYFISMGPGEDYSTTVTWYEETTMEPGNWTMSLYVSPIAAAGGSDVEDTNPENNRLDYPVRIRAVEWAADMDGSGKIDILDIFVAASSFGAIPGQPRYDARADINGDGRIDIIDIFMIARVWGKYFTDIYGIYID
jgi:hypothetical protein